MLLISCFQCIEPQLLTISAGGPHKTSLKARGPDQTIQFTDQTIRFTDQTIRFTDQTIRFTETFFSNFVEVVSPKARVLELRVPTCQHVELSTFTILQMKCIRFLRSFVAVFTNVWPFKVHSAVTQVHSAVTQVHSAVFESYFPLAVTSIRLLYYSTDDMSL